MTAGHFAPRDWDADRACPDRDGEARFDGLVLRWQRSDFARVREQWPDLTEHYGDNYDIYSARILRAARHCSNIGAGQVHIVTVSLADFEAYAQRTGGDFTRRYARSEYLQWCFANHPEWAEQWLWSPDTEQQGG